MADNTSGHQSAPHAADLRIKAWAPTREGRIRQAVLGTVATIQESSTARPNHTRRLTADRDDDLLVAVLDEVIYLLNITGEAPVDLGPRRVDGGVDATFAMADASTLPQIGAVPKAMSLNEIHFSHDHNGWRCSATLDV